MNSGATVLITSAGRRGQLVHFFKGIANKFNGSVLVADASKLAPTAYLADQAFLVPRIDSGSYLEALLEICERQSVRLLVPTIDTELEILSGASKQFASLGTLVLVSDPETIAVSADKQKTNRWLLEHGFPAPRQRALHGINETTFDLPFPVFVKPARGSRSVGAQVVERFEDFSGLNATDDFLAEELIQGEEYTVSTYVDLQGRCLAAVPRQRVEVRDGEVSKSVTRHLPDVENVCARIVESLIGAWGPLNVQLIRDSGSGDYKIIEINARFGGGDPLAWEAGANAPKWAMMEALGFEPEQFADWKKNLAMLRFDDAVFINADE